MGRICKVGWLQGSLSPRAGEGGYIVSQFLNELEVHFIQTQRLFADQLAMRPDRYYAQAGIRRGQPPRRSMVMKLSDDLTDKIREALAENSRNSQQLDRDFPRRIMLDQE